MSKAIVIEVQGGAAGIVVGSNGRFRFFSSQPAFDGLDGKTFRSVEQANRAVADRRAGQRLPRAA
ncbi:MAG TPA: hypothetical protein VGN82_12400 [Bosea sp. (in: a-proteobacteria)]|jgi:hypothetical protein|uniref:hypothetical protein n=1 Tax=Bosea sp. (in: a-proteobacteria) TaxID=1871050 RepID=UPI002E1309B4|nr:hypothetical protein [Bosea sp. (in: a-proteobacteria)]